MKHKSGIFKDFGTGKVPKS